MKEFINKVEIQGAVGSVKRSAYGDKSVERFSVVTDTTYSQGGMMIVDTTWFSVTRFVPTNSPEEIKKGDWVHVDGRFRTQKYCDQNGNDRVSYDVVATSVDIIKEG